MKSEGGTQIIFENIGTDQFIKTNLRDASKLPTKKKGETESTKQLIEKIARSSRIKKKE